MPRFPRLRPVLTLLLVGLFTGCSGQGGPASQGRTEAPPAATARPPTTSAPTAAPAAVASPGTTASPPRIRELPTRVVMRDLGIDLPIVSGDLDLPGNPPDYPLCGVAQYLTIYRDPSRLGATTWIYGHARPGMLLPLLEASTVKNGAALVGAMVDLYSDAAKRYTFRVTTVLRHAEDRSAATDVPADGRRLILQTSEGPAGTVPKLQVVAEFVSVAPADRAEAMPSASPTECFVGP